MKTLTRFLAVGALVIIVLATCLALSLNHTLAQPEHGTSDAQNNNEVEAQPTRHLETWALAIGAAVSVSAGSLGAAYAVGKVGAAALGAASEKPELLGRSLVFVGLAEGVAIYGLIIAIMLYTKLGA